MTHEGLTTKGTPRKRSPNGARIEKVCPECGSAFSVRPCEDWIVCCSRSCADGRKGARGRRPGFIIIDEHREKLRQAKLGIRGPDHWNWRGGAGRSERQIAMARDEYKQWRKAVFDRDSYTCQMCGATGVYLNADHIKPWATHPDLRYDVANGRTLCVPCHRTTPTWGARLRRAIERNPERVVGYTKRGRPVFEVAGGADNKTIDNGGLADFTTATDEIAGVDYQYVKLADGTDGSTAKIGGDATNGLDVDVTRIAAGAKIMLTDGTDDATISVAGARKPLDVHLIDSSGAVISSFGGAGGTSAADDADFTQGSTVATPIQGVYESVATSVTDNDMGIIGIDANRRVRVSVDASTLDVAHDAVDANAPVKTGARGVSALPTRVATNDRTNNISDLWGRQLVTSIDPAMQTWKGYNTTSTATGAVVWLPASGKKIAITHFTIGTYGTTSARLILWFGDLADTTYTAGTDQLAFAAKFYPSTTAGPGAVVQPPTPIYCQTADRELHVTTDAALSFDLTVYGFEWS